MSVISIEQLQAVLGYFKDPFLPEGMVKDRWVDDGVLEIQIAGRFIWLDRNGRVEVSGTDVTWVPPRSLVPKVSVP